MKSVILFLSCVLFASCSMEKVESQKLNDDQKPKTENQKAKQPVLVELFTSEGCSSCPPADRVLAFLEKEQPSAQAEIITLALHVDYWDDGGWKDVYSSPLFTQRQEFYSQKFKLDSIYTPQMVVDGTQEFVGNDSGKAAKVINEAAKTQKGKVEIAKNEDKLTIKISDLPEHENTTVYLAIAENNLVSNVARGENSGKKLEHQSVVRELKAIGNLNAQQKSSEIETTLPMNSIWKQENLRIIVFAQENSSRKILGVGRITLEKN
ncbi:MAG: DUF1223 domain-containing protein [Actinomycetota bacterium]